VKNVLSLTSLIRGGFCFCPIYWNLQAVFQTSSQGLGQSTVVGIGAARRLSNG
jgi:hypothetical protein